MKKPEDDSACGTSPKNPKCTINTDGCSSLMGNVFFDVCAFHTWLMPRPERFGCACGKTFYQIGGFGYHGRNTFFSYHMSKNSPYKHISMDDILVNDFEGTFCCRNARSGHPCRYRCGDVKVCVQCIDKHPGCNPKEKSTLMPHELDTSFIPINCCVSLDDINREIYRSKRGLLYMVYDNKLQFVWPTGPISSAAKAIQLAAFLVGPYQSQLFYIAGFFSDCPEAVTRHFG